MATPLDAATIEEKMTYLASSEFFNGQPEALIRDVATEAGWLRLPVGETLIHQGEQGDGLFVLIGGRLRVYRKAADGHETVLGEIERGEVVGEMAVLTEETRSASVRAIRDCHLAQLTRESFNRLEARHPELMRQIARLLVKRLKVDEATRHIHHTTNVVLVPAGKDAPLADFARLLVEALSRVGSVLHLSRGRFDDIWGEGSADSPRDDPRVLPFINWFGQQERQHPFVVLECDADAQRWNSRCIGQADRIFLVGRAGAEPGRNAVEVACLGETRANDIARQELVLVHPDGSARPSGTRAWIASRDVYRHHHIRLNVRADFERLVRMLTGKTTGLVLGGGGARGFAHIGVIRAFRELGIPVDFVGGTSMGAIVAGQCALGLSLEEMLEVTRAGFVAMNPLKDYTFPMIGIINGRRMNQVLAMMFKDALIEDLWLNFFCVSNNLTRAQVVVHTSGPLWRRVRASVSVPGVIAPVLEGGELIVDGGVLNNLPVDVMQRQCEGNVIAVDVSPRIDIKTDLPDGEHLSGWGLLWKQINPFAKKPVLPTLMKVMSRTTMLASVNNSEAMQRRADLYLHPPVDDIDMFAWDALDDLVDIGYRFAMAKLTAWQQARAETT